jgi:hypothetical protein
MMTEQTPLNRTASFESVWATLDRIAAEEERRQQEEKEAAERRRAEEERQRAEDERRRVEWERGMAELREAQKETDRQLKHLKIQVSGVSDNAGYGAETYFQTALDKSLEFGGIQFDDMIPNLRKRHHGANCEFDIVLVNHDAVAVIDAKHRIHQEQAEELATKKAKIFREFFPEYREYKLYLGLAGFSMEEAVEAEARAYGVGLLKQEGNAVKAVDIPLKAY